MANKKYYVNEEIRYSEVMVIGEEGNSLGVMDLNTAIETAQSADLDLILVSEGGKVPVCKIMDYGKFIYNIQKKEKANKKASGDLKEIRLSLSINDHDLQTKANQAKKFLASGDKVKVVLRIRGREIVMADMGYEVIQKFVEMSNGVVEKEPKLEGRVMHCIIKRQ